MLLELYREPLADDAEPGFDAEEQEDVNDVVACFQRVQVRDGQGGFGKHRTEGFRQRFVVGALGSACPVVLVDGVALFLHHRRFRVTGFVAQYLFENAVKPPLVAVVVEVTDAVVPFEPELSGQFADRDCACVLGPFGPSSGSPPGDALYSRGLW